MRYHTRRRYQPLRLVVNLVLAVCLLSIFLISTVFKLRTIVIYGSPQEFTNFNFLSHSQNILFIDTHALEKEISLRHPSIKSVKVTKRFPDSLEIYIEVRTPIMRITVGSEGLFIDQEGKVLSADASQKHLDYPTLRCLVDKANVGEVLDVPNIVLVAETVNTILEHKTAKIKEVSCQDDGSFSFLADGLEIIISAQNNPDDIDSSLQYLFKQFRIEGTRPKKIDLRFNKPVFNPVQFEEASGTEDLE